MKVEVLSGHISTKLRKKPFYPGEIIELDDREARRLIGMKVVKEVIAVAEEPTKASQQLNVPDTVKLVMAAATYNELLQFEEGEKRQGVLAAINKRRSELEQAHQASTIIHVGTIASIDELDQFAATDQRQDVQAAIAKRRAELTPPA